MTSLKGPIQDSMSNFITKSKNLRKIFKIWLKIKNFFFVARFWNAMFTLDNFPVIYEHWPNSPMKCFDCRYHRMDNLLPLCEAIGYVSVCLFPKQESPSIADELKSKV